MHDNEEIRGEGRQAHRRAVRQDHRKHREHGGEHRHDRREYAEKTNPFYFSVIVGAFAGLFWGLARWLAAGFKFTMVPQAFLADPFVRRNVLASAGWQWIGLLLFIAMSVVAALVYWLLLGRLRGPWPGIAFGAAWWALLFLVLGPRTGLAEPVQTLGWPTIITELCLYIIWGLFIGYSIAFEFNDEAAREPIGKPGKSGREPQPSS
ncbi:YqhR family membrane protein [Cohnella lubricantis]|uniref:DUF1440 domain-containing protein n=1 Tax=Cohnella lubricantis TaxID=2163172 RepID=A0A841TAJ5_9BACL|nr:YqhR family membrane protein [Cohnella lubricantis]MBB6676418.1 hypothetical protein [Cohnella lubricantis]MBP2117575.1 hypothetical protein [Cohnella lubricantis]